MNTERLSGAREKPGKDVLAETRKGRLDLVVLQFMAKKIFVTLSALERPAEAALPLSYAFEELRGRHHRMIMFAPHELLTLAEICFVGFVSRRSQTVEQQVIEAIFRADELMMAELTYVPGLLSYSSLELHLGIWYNLVLFRDNSVKTHVKSIETHRHAAYELSPAYYEWIRLYNGTLPGGLARQELQLKSTKYYRFPGSQQPPMVHELNDETCTNAC